MRKGYNQRLFEQGVRARLHLARFQWVRRVTARITHDRVLELGCFDGRLLNYIAPLTYTGIDAGWEGGVESAIQAYGGDTSRTFLKCADPAILASFPDQSFDLGVALETLEHIDPILLETYLAETARLCAAFVVTVPNEKGPVFLAKWLLKRGLLRDHDPSKYTLREVVNSTLGRTHLVSRDEHKGFDYTTLIASLSNHFEIVSVTGLPFGPPYLAFSVAVVAKSRWNHQVNATQRAA